MINSATNVAKQLVVTCGIGHHSVLVLDYLNPVRTVAGDLEFESNPCNHNGIAPKQRCDTSQYRTGLLNEL